jgi:single-stranded DNA-specific DHH superfamily exonuclease
MYELYHKVDRIHERRQGKEQTRETNAYHFLVVVLAKRASATSISSKAIFKLLSSGPIPKTPAFQSPHSVTMYSY